MTWFCWNYKTNYENQNLRTQTQFSTEPIRKSTVAEHTSCLSNIPNYYARMYRKANEIHKHLKNFNK